MNRESVLSTLDRDGASGAARSVPADKAPAPRLTPGFANRLNLVTDLLLVLGAIILSAWLPAKGAALAVWTPTLLISVLGAAGVWIVAGAALGLYTPNATEAGTLDRVALATVQVMAVVTIQALVNLLAPPKVAVPSLQAFLLCVWPAVVALRLLVFRRISDRELPLEEVLVVGAGTMGQLTGKSLEASGRQKVIGYLRYSDEAGLQSPEPVLGNVGELAAVLRKVPVDVVYVAGNARKHGDEMQAAIKQCERFGVPFALPAYQFRLDRSRPAASHGVDGGFLRFVTHDARRHELALKRLFDIAVSGMALWVLLPLLGAVAAAIKLTSRGPVFFRQVRVGLNGRPFHMLKFRSMVVNAEALKEKLAQLNEQTGPVFKMKNDPRVTAVGRFIRKYSIDELPQLLNVLRGEMSIVGPRPPVPNEVAKYEAWQRRRLSVRPGLTCIWQVSGRNQIGFDQWMYLDMQYIDHWSLKKDLDLILKTVPVVLTGSGAS